MIEKFNYTVLNWVTSDEDGEDIIGVMVQVDNGDTQYLTLEEFKQFNANRNSE